MIARLIQKVVQTTPLAVLIVIPFIVGISLAELTQPMLTQQLIFLGGFLALLLYTQIFKLRRLAMLLILLVILHFGTVRTMLYNQPPNSLPLLQKWGNQTVTLKGTVATQIILHQQRKSILGEDAEHPQEHQTGSFLLTVSSLNGQMITPITAEVRARETFPSFDIGDIVECEGKIRVPVKPTNPGQLDYAKYLERKHVYATLSVSNADSFKILRKCPSVNLTSFIHRVRQHLKKAFESSLRPDEAGYMSALILGYKASVPEELNQDLKKTGTAYFLVVSGLHVWIFVGAVWFFLHLLSIGYRLQSVILIGVVFCYALLTGGEPPVTRAAIMLIAYMLSDLLWRRRHIFNALAVSALVVLCVNPNQLFDIGFQLSYVGVLGIALITKALQQQFMWEKHYFTSHLTLSLSAWLAIAPLLASCFSLVTPCILIANLLLSLIITFQMLAGLAFLVFAQIGIFLPPWLIGGSVSLVKLLTSFLSNLPFSYFYVPAPPWWLIALYYALLTVWLLWIKVKPHILKPFALIFIIALLPLPLWLHQKVDGLFIAMLDVGRGNCVYVEYPNGHNILYDVGSGAYQDAGKTIAVPFLFNRYITHLDELVLSHTDSDHINGVRTVSEMLQVRRVVVSRYFGNYPQGAELLSFFQQKDIPVYPVEREIERAEPLKGYLEILAPPAWEKYNVHPKSNDTSLVAKVRYQDMTFLLTGDMHEKETEELMNTTIDLHADIVQVPHHGKYFRKSILFAEKVHPAITLISTNPDFYSAEVVEKYHALGSTVYLTCTEGALLFTMKDKHAIRRESQ